MKLFSRHYGMKSDQIYSFDWEFLKPIIEKLDNIGEEYYVCHSHYNDQRIQYRYHATFRIYGTDTIIEKFNKIEPTLVKALNYHPFDKDDENIKGQLTLKKIADSYNISEQEMIDIFKIWDSTSRLKVSLIELWQNGGSNSWDWGVHYALNSIGIQRLSKIHGNHLYYREEEVFRTRNFPKR